MNSNDDYIEKKVKKEKKLKYKNISIFILYIFCA